MDNKKVKRETARYEKIPEIIDFRDADGNNLMKEQIQLNDDRIKQDIKQIVIDELERIKNDPDLQHLVKSE